MKKIDLKNGYTALVDNADYARISLYKWDAQIKHRKDGSIANVYAVRHVRTEDGKRTTQCMQRLVLGVYDPSIRVDHFPDRSGLNNQRRNLRLATHAENSRNQVLSINNTSGFKGVVWHKVHNKWGAKITVNGNTKFLGNYQTAKEAASAYDKAAIKFHGIFAKTNKMLEAA